MIRKGYRKSWQERMGAKDSWDKDLGGDKWGVLWEEGAEL